MNPTSVLPPEIIDLAVAIGLLHKVGTNLEFDSDWFSNPGPKVSRALADEDRRNSLISFVDAVNGDSAVTESGGVKLLKVFDASELDVPNPPKLKVMLSIDDRASTYVEVGVAVSFATTTTPRTHTEVIVPLYRTGKTAGTTVSSVAEHFALAAGAPIRVATSIDVDSTPDASGFALGGVDIAATVPVDGSPPTIEIALRDLALPGAPTPTTIRIGGAGSSIQESLLSLVLGVVRAAAGALGGAGQEALSALDLIGLGPDPLLEPIDVGELATRGVVALHDWFIATMADPRRRHAWLGSVKGLVGGDLGAFDPLHPDASLSIPLAAGVAITVGVTVRTGPGGHLQVTPQLGVALTKTLGLNPDAFHLQARATVDVVTIDLADASLTAIPRAELVVDLSGATKRLLSTGPVQIGGAHIGIAIIGGDVVPVVRLLDVQTGSGSPHPVVDLSSPDAAVAALGEVAGDLVRTALAALPAHVHLEALLGLVATGASSTLDSGRLLVDPLGALAEWWHELLTQHVADVPGVLAHLRDLLAHDTKAAVNGNVVPSIGGTGVASDPWSVPLVGRVTLDAWMDGPRLTVAISIGFRVDTLGGGCTVVESRLRVELASIGLDAAARDAHLLPAVELLVSMRGRGLPEARLALGPVTVAAGSIGLVARWTAASGFGVELAAPNLHAEIDGVSLPLAFPVNGDWRGTVLGDLERLVAVLGATQPLGWLHDLLGLFGWTLGGDEHPHRLSLENLSTDPVSALRTWAGALIADADLIARATSAAAKVVSGTGTGRSGSMRGQGTVDDPWLLAFADEDGPSLSVALSPDGPVRLASFTSTVISQWLPGLPGLPMLGLARAILDEAPAGPDAAGMAAGRAQLGNGLGDLLARTLGTDGLVIAPPAPIDGVIFVVDPARSARSWSSLDATTALNAEPDPTAAIVRIAVVADGVDAAHLPWSAIPADRLIDLRAPGLAPESFTVTAPDAGEWFVLLAPRADAALGVSDPSGVNGQAARLDRVLRLLANGRPVVVVALGGAGHAARLAADRVTGVTDLITLGTPWSPIAFDTFRNGSSGDAVRVLRALLPALDLTESDDPDLALGRELIDSWLDASAQFELDAPRPSVSVRPALRVRAWFGALEQPSVERALTAIVAAGLSSRALVRSVVTAAAPTAVRLGVRVPLPASTGASGHGIAVSGHLDLGVAARPLAGNPLAEHPRLRLHIELSDADGWLIGGPGTTPPPSAPPLELRRLALSVEIDLGGSDHRARLLLHDVSALGGYRDLVVIEPEGTGSIETLPFLPEARAVLNALIVRLSAAETGSPALAVLNAFVGIGLATTQGLVADAFTQLLHDPSAFVSAAVGTALRRASLADALVALVPGAARAGDRITIATGAFTATLDLMTRRGECSVAGRGVLPWTATVADLGAAQPRGSFTIGSPSANSAVAVLTFAPGTSGAPATITVTLESHAVANGAVERVAIWPQADVDGLADLARKALPAEAVRLVLEGVRGLDAGVGAAIDALGSALGILGDADADGRRAIVAPLGLFRDPGAWLRNHVLGDGTTLRVDAVVDLLEAVKPFLDLVSTPRGTWPVVPGVLVHVTNGASGARLGCEIDPTAWLGGAGRVPFAAGIDVGLTVPATGNPHSTVELYAGAPDASGTRRNAVHVLLDGTDLRVFLRKASGDDLAIYPHAAGLDSLLSSGTELLLPMALNELAKLSGDAARTQVATLVNAFGRGLAIVNTPVTSPVTFSGDKIHQLAQGMPSWLEQHALALLAEAAAALNPLLAQLPGTVSATMSGDDLVVRVRGVALTVQPRPLRVSVAADVSGLPVIDNVTVSFSADATGVTDWGFGVGPARFDLGGPVLRPLVRGGRTAVGWEVGLGLALDDSSQVTAGHKELFGRWRSADGFDLVARTRTLSADDDVSATTDAGRVALFAADAVLELLGNWVIGITDVDTMLERTVNGQSVRSLLTGSLLSVADDHKLASAPISSVPTNLFTLARKLAGALPALPLGPVRLSLHLDGDLIGLRLDVIDREKGLLLNSGSSPEISIVTKASWIEPPSGLAPDPGIVIDLLSISTAAVPVVSIQPAFAANGIGVRIGSSNGPLLDSGLRIDAVAVHLFGKLVRDGGGVAVSGGIHVELDGLAVPLGGGGGDNAVAKGVMADAGGSGGPPKPKFSPALAVQAHHGEPGIAVSLTAGDGDGPWYLPIQKAFGPLYLEQVGLGATHIGTPRHLDAISLSLDGSVSLFGITASVDKLRLTYHVTKPFFELSSWEVDVDGFAISSSIGGLTLAGALLKTKLTGAQTGYDYLGMLKIGFNGYGVDLFGGYASPNDGSGSYASFFAFGALHAPLGGPPAFFITGIGIGFGINRELKAPSMETITSNPFLVAMKALGPAPDPKEQLLHMQQEIAPKRGEYWVAAGISFTSFVLISGEVVVTVAFGDGLEITLLGLARAELPTPVLKLVSIELALLARFSTKEGSLLVQAQLTENSWLLTESVRLTGGFAFATWWKGPNAGQFVVTMGGYHPKFHHDGYPTVPRLGFRWQPIDNVSIIGENYFALCSEALMAGTRFEANAHFGPAHARVSFGADGIVYFDPFWFEISAYAEIAAGIKLWLLFGTVTIELSLGASVTITGPPIFVQGRFEICGFEVPFEFGDRADPTDNALSNTEFRNKYLRASSDAQVLQATVLKGSVAAGRKIDGAPAKVPDGSALNPFLVVPEFEVVFISTAPTIDMSLSHTGEPALTMHVGGTDIGVAPMMSHTLLSNFHVGLTKLAAPVAFSIQGIAVEPRALASFPKGIWGEAQDPHAKRLPEGKTVDASDGFTMSTSLIDPSGAAPIDYHQVELRIDHKRKPLPFVVDAARTNARTTDAAALTTVAAAITDGESNDDARFSTAAAVLRHGGYGPLGVAALRGERAAAPKLGSLADDLAKAPKPVSRTVTPTVVTRTKETLVVSARVSAVMTPELSTVLPSNTRTTVKDPGAAVLRTAPSIDGERAAMNALAPAALLVIEPRGVAFERRTILAAGDIALTRLATSPVAAVANASPDRSAARRLATLGAGLLGDGMILHDGEVAVIAPGSRPTGEQPHRLAIAGGPTRIVCFAAGGNVLFDDIVSSPAAGEPSVLTIEIPTKCERLTVAGIGTARTVGGELDGWYRGQTLPLVGWDMVLAASAIVRFGAHKVGHHAERANGGWANTRELTRAAQVATRFDHAVTSVAIAVDDLGGADAASAIEMRLVGAVRALDARGQPVAPTVLVDGVRSVLVYDITPVQDPGAFDPNVTVIVDNCRTGQLGGVVATTLGSASLVAAITTAGFDAAVAAAVPGGAGTRRVTWSTAEPGHGPLAAPPKLPAKKTTTAKKTTASTPPSPTRVARRRTTGPSARGDG